MTSLKISVAIAGALAAAALALGSDFDLGLTGETLRVDYYRSGDAGREEVTLDKLYRQGPWAGPTVGLDDPPPYGGTRVELRNAGSGALLYARGYDSYFGEYRSTGPAAEGVGRTFHETVLLPMPKRAALVTLTAVGRDGTLRTLAEIPVDPSSTAISDEPPARGVLTVDAHVVAAPRVAVDFAIVGEGYTESEIEVFRSDLQRATEVLLGFEPFAARKDRINVRGVLLPSAQSGCDEPTRGRFRDTALGLSYNSLGSPRYLLTERNRRLRDVAANVPYDALIIMVNHDRYGGGGIFGLYCTFAAHSPWAEYLLLHELGHSFAALADEYYSSSVAYNDFYPRGREPLEPNITALLDPANLKWKDLLTPGIEIPTPWEKDGYDAADSDYQTERRKLDEAIAEATRSGAAESKIAELRRAEERHAAEHAAWAEDYLSRSRFAGRVGAFEGAGYSSTGLYRPQLDCLMFTRRAQPLCVVCRRAVESMISRYAP